VVKRYAGWPAKNKKSVSTANGLRPRREHSSPASRAAENLALACGLCQAVGMATKRTKADRLERQTEQLEKMAERHPDEIEKEPLRLAPKSDEPTVLILIKQQIRQRAYELYEQRGRADGHDLDDWLQAEREIKGRQANAATA
jgi:hypothetical protein